MGILVRAYREGFHGGRRYRAGAEFTVPSTTIESSWFEPVKAGEKLRPRPDLTQAQRVQAAKEARSKRKRLLAEKAKAKLLEKPARDRPTALSEVTQQEQRTAVEKIAAPAAREVDEVDAPLA